MIYVAICDDEISVGSELERTLIEIFCKLNIKYEINIFFSGEELYQKMATGAHYDLIFLDIEFAHDKANGVEIGRMIREVQRNYLASIVFISWEKEYALQLFEIQPLNFLVKPLLYQEVENVINKYLVVTDFLAYIFTYKVGHDTFKVQKKNIVFFENSERKVIIHLSDGRRDMFYGSLKELYEKQLKSFDFLFIHASYVVNYQYIEALRFNQVQLLGSVRSLPVSKYKKNEVREKYFEIVKKYMR
jgi:DNA-binding LytR/AlgR family response regulator